MKRIALILSAISALCLSGCENLTPQERATILDLGKKVVETKLLPSAQK